MRPTCCTDRNGHGRESSRQTGRRLEAVLRLSEAHLSPRGIYLVPMKPSFVIGSPTQPVAVDRREPVYVPDREEIAQRWPLR